LAKCPQKNRRHDRLEGDSSITITVVEDVRIEDCAILRILKTNISVNWEITDGTSCAYLTMRLLVHFDNDNQRESRIMLLVNKHNTVVILNFSKLVKYISNKDKSFFSLQYCDGRILGIPLRVMGSETQSLCRRQYLLVRNW